MKTEVNNSKGRIITIIGLIMMIALTVIKAIFSSNLAAQVLIISGIALFFIVEAVEKTPDEESGLRFKTFFSDLKKPGVILLILVSVALTLIEMFLDKWVFGDELVKHVLERASIMTNTSVMVVLVNQIFVVLGEEIGFRGFFVGKGMKNFPFWPVAIVSALTFAFAHFTAGPVAIVARDLAGIFIDAVIFAVLYRKTNNCLISCVPHFLGNMLGYLLIPLIF